MMYRKLLFFALITVFLVGAANAADPNLVGWWKMDADDSAGNVVADSSGNGYDGTKGADITWDNGSLKFTSDYSSGIQFDSTTVADMFDSIDETITVSFWMNIANGDARHDIFKGNSTINTAKCQLEMFGSSTHHDIWAHLGANNDKLIRWGVNNPESDNYLALPKRWSMVTLTKDINGGELIDPNDPMSGMTGVIKLYVDGVLLQSDVRLPSWSDGGHELNNSLAGIDAFQIAGVDWAWYKGNLKDFMIYDRVLSDSEVDALTNDYFKKAHIPDPFDGGRAALDEGETEVVLSWKAGYYAASHDVYFGTDFDDVNNATNASAEFMGNQAGNSFTVDPITSGTYYWRVDEINDVDVWTGEVWSLEVVTMPDAVLWLKMDGPDSSDARLVKDYSVYGNDGTMGSSDQWTEIPGLGGAIDFAGGNWGATQVKFVDDGNDLIADMGLTDKVTISFVMTGHVAGDNGYAFTGLNSLNSHIMSMEAPTGSGRHFLTKMGGVDSSKWMWEAFNPEDSRYIFSETDVIRLTVTVDFTAGQVIYYLDSDVWGTHNISGGDFTDLTSFIIAKNDYHAFDMTMSDFRIYDEVLLQEQIAKIVGDFPKIARKPIPADGSTDNALDVVLGWNPGLGSDSHHVYFGTDENVVANADTGSAVYVGELDVNSYDPGGLELFKTYYWRVDEVDEEGGIMEGPVWSFDTLESIMVEDFESYDNDGNDVTVAWVDVDTSGAGDMQRFLATDPGYPVLSMVNSLRLRYRLTAWGDLAYYAKTRRSFSPAQDWTANGVKILSVNYYGDAGNFGLPMFVTVGDGTTEASVYVDANTLAESWNEANASLSEVAAAGVDLTNVTYMEIGFGDGTNLGSSSSQYDMIYIDDIALYPPKCVLSESSLTADITQDCVVNYDDLAYVTDGWLRGSSADAITAAGPVGLWLFDDDTDLLKATVGSDLTTGNYPVTGDPVSATAGITAGDGAIMVPINTYLEMTNPITPAPGETRVNEYTMVWEVNIPAASAYASLRWVALGEYDTVDLSSDVDISVIYAKSSVDYDNGLFGTHQGWSADLVVPDQWYQLAISVKNGLFYNCYVNGELAVSTPPQAVDGRYSIGDSFHLFKDNEDEDPDINCSTFALFDRALTAEEIKSLVPIQLLKGDLNDDVAIDFADYSILAGEWLVEDLWP